MRKRGKTIKHNIASIPGTAKKALYQLPAEAALLALRGGCFNDDHLANLWVLSELCEALNVSQGNEQYINSHAASVRRMIEAIHSKDECGSVDYMSIEPSVNILLEWFDKQPNSLIAKIAYKTINKLNNPKRTK